jgi:hypothetical protein
MNAIKSKFRSTITDILLICSFEVQQELPPNIDKLLSEKQVEKSH